MRTPRPATHRLLAALLTATLAVALPACGDDDTNANNDQPDAAQSSPAGGESNATDGSADATPASDEAQIRALVAGVERAFKTADGQVLCDSLTDRGQKDLVDFAKTTGLTGSCLDVANRLLKRELAAKTKQRPSEVVAVRVNGDRARALLRVAGTTTFQQHYQKVDGRWKVISFNLAVLNQAPPNPS